MRKPGVGQERRLSFVVHYSEVALKGKNRPDFVRTLRHNISRALSGLNPEVSLLDGRLIVTTDPTEEAEARLSKVFGVAFLSRVELLPQDMEAISERVLTIAKGSKALTFGIRARRTDKSFPFSSQEIGRALGSLVSDRTGKKVDLTHPDLPIHVDIVKGSSLVYSDRVTGPGGLPLGSAGRVMHLFSGGIDSPPAAWLMMKRGAVPVYLHFYLAPGPDVVLQSKVVRLVKTLSSFQGRSTLVLVPFADYQLSTLGRASDLEPSLFRRFMRMTAELLAPKFGASAISTGDSLSQAASQTLWNLGAFDRGSTLPILRPLLGYDKEEIVTLAKRIGTYEDSLEEYKDCCAIITRHPKTKVREDSITDMARDLDFDRLALSSLDNATLVTYSPTRDAVKAVPLGERVPLRTVARAEAKL
jgi:tRNA uracil 4-sulfurtransferase